MTPKEECEGMMDELVGNAERLLVQQGEFHPFAAILREEGKVESVPATPPIPSALAAALETRARASEAVRAACIVVLVSVAHPATGEAVDAIRLAIDHRDGYAAHVFFPYQISEEATEGGSAKTREVLWGEPFATRGVSYAFRGEQYPT